MKAETQQWTMFVGLISVMIAAMGFMTYTLNARMGSLEVRMNNIETRIVGLDTMVDQKFEALNEKLNQLLIALAGRGVNLPAKPEGKHSRAEQ